MSNLIRLFVARYLIRLLTVALHALARPDCLDSFNPVTTTYLCSALSTSLWYFRSEDNLFLTFFLNFIRQQELTCSSEHL